MLIPGGRRALSLRSGTAYGAPAEIYTSLSGQARSLLRLLFA